MTIEFTIDQWTQQVPGFFSVKLTINEALHNPSLHVFKYIDTETKTQIASIIPTMLSYITTSNFIMIQNNEPFAGYIAVR